ncbi:MAG: hypothetical protein ACI87N_001035 [Flavobacteriales bacterium]|jgi:hypothetical protein
MNKKEIPKEIKLALEMEDNQNITVKLIIASNE